MFRSPPQQPQGWVIAKLDETQARRAVIAQEWLRIILGGRQPKAEYLEAAPGSYAVKIDNVPGFVHFKPHAVSEVKEKILEGELKGLGQLLVACLFLNEVNLTLGSLGVSANQVVKIGTECVWKGDTPCKDSIEAIDLIVLPLLANHFVKNWLDRVIDGHMPTWPILACKELKDNPQFMAEVNEGILRCLLLQDDFIKAIVRECTNSPYETQRISLELMLRKRDLRKAAFNKVSFIEYLTSSAAEHTVMVHKQQVVMSELEDKRDALFIELRRDALTLGHVTPLPPLLPFPPIVHVRPLVAKKQISDSVLPELKPTQKHF